MTVIVNFTTDTVAELHLEMQALLAGTFANRASAAAQTAPGAGAANATPETDKSARGRRATRATAETGQAISTGEERTDAVAQDAADEAADTAKEKAAEPAKLTHDDVKKMMSGYAQAYGMDAAQADGAAFIGAKMISALPEDQTALAKAVIGVAVGFEKNSNKREMTGEISPEKMAEMKAIVQIARAVTGK